MDTSTPAVSPLRQRMLDDMRMRNRGEVMVKMQPVHLPRTLPVIPSREEVGRLIPAAGNP